ncbi:flavin-dependent dehydrogenase [Sphingobium sp. OAS761]|uniref:NAD(P)/FAD-dependent oxidoreductase n=1 Tax=Sphingobium sp. OAS761 TaxID=2817901 RepID=UPI00209E49BA|nr:NAD(P)/FAD-dependent oxidoreductase [Sphingobium sp. OAS761]MCP1469501.1 flavin-dependent dehydrogenase [Sphingobium sp. OAS761]
MTRPIVLGAGPAGSMAALMLAEGGSEPILIDRDAEVGDAICGGFLSWRTVEGLRQLGCDPAALGAMPVTRLRLFAKRRTAEAALPEKAYGLSRHGLDSALRQLAIAKGARLEIDRARSVAPGIIEGERRRWESPAIFLATGKHDVRGERRPRDMVNPALGVRVRLPPSAELERLIGAAIELHLFPGGYAGIVLQEGGSANVCLALRKSALADAGGDPWEMLQAVGRENPHFACRMACAEAPLSVDTIGAIPYGWIAQETEEGVYRLGDQAAVIPSLAGEGMAIALASGKAAAQSYLKGVGAPQYQRSFAKRAARPVGVASLLWHIAETPSGALAMTLASRICAGLAMRLSRIH